MVQTKLEDKAERDCVVLAWCMYVCACATVCFYGLHVYEGVLSFVKTDVGGGKIVAVECITKTEQTINKKIKSTKEKED